MQYHFSPKTLLALAVVLCVVTLVVMFCVGFALNRESDTGGWYGNPGGKDMKLDDVRGLAAKGDSLLFEDLRQYRGANASSDLNRYIMVYSIEGGYRLVVHSNSSGKPESVNLESIWQDGGSGIDIRYADVEEFLRANPSQDSVTEQQAAEIAQSRLGIEVEAVSWYILGDQPQGTDSDAVFARALLDSTQTLDEPCWILRVKDTPEWAGQYYAVGKKSGTILVCDANDREKITWGVLE